MRATWRGWRRAAWMDVPCAWRRSRKNRWRVESRGASRVTLTYRVYGREMSVRTNWIESRFALLNGAPTFITLADTTVRRPHFVTLELPATWTTSVSGLTDLAGAAHRYRAEDFDELVDRPILAGNPVMHEFEVGGRKHVLVNEGEAGVWDGARAARDLERDRRRRGAVLGPAALCQATSSST